MNATSLDRVTRSLVRLPSRRDVLRGLAAVGLGLGSVRWPDFTEAKKKRKRKKKKKIKRNDFGCVSVGKFCKNHRQCCSGICKGREPGDMKICWAHGTGTCDQDGPDLCAPLNPALVLCNGGDECACVRTTAGSAFCGDVGFETGTDCADCQTDADCEALGFPPGSACAPLSQGEICADSCAGGMACLVPCGYEPPEL